MYDNKEKKQFFRGHMKRRIKACVCAAFFAASAFVFAGCSIQNMEPERIRDVEYTVVDKDEVPEEFKARIEEEKEEPMKLFYADGRYLYAARGYGEQKTSGYSVRVTDCFEGEEGVYIETSLLGPDKGEEIRKSAACPYVVVKMEYIDKQIIFQ